MLPGLAHMRYDKTPIELIDSLALECDASQISTFDYLTPSGFLETCAACCHVTS